MSSEKKKDVGFGKPPMATRFQPGTSGNPAGRPKAKSSFTNDCERELSQRITVTENGKRQTVTKRAALAKLIANKAIGGDPRSMMILINILLQIHKVDVQRVIAQEQERGREAPPQFKKLSPEENILRIKELLKKGMRQKPECASEGTGKE